MKKEIIISILITKYNSIYPDDKVPENFNKLDNDEKIAILNKALEDKIKIKDLL